MIKFITTICIASLCVVGVFCAVIGVFLVSTPRPTTLKSCLTTEMYKIRLCPKDPTYVTLKQISPHARNAVIVSEDAGFYGHKGFDWNELRASIERNFEKGEYVRGGSTISQQLAKNVYLSSEKSILRKLREALITIQIENQFTKDEILEKYLNVVEFGPEIFGISKASQYYFKKPASQLSIAEGAFLAFLLPSPKKYSVSFQKKQLTPFARRQVQEIVDRLFRFRKISEEQLAQATVDVSSIFGVSAPPPSPTEGLTPSVEERADEAEQIEMEPTHPENSTTTEI